MRKILHILGRVVLLLITLILAIYLALWIWNIFVKALPDDEVNFGVTFSDIYADELKIDWRETYLAILDDLGVKNLRISAYWTEVEPEKDNFNFERMDFQVQEASKRDVNIILGVGQKLPRWPECFVPGWAKDDENKDKELLSYIETVVNRYKNVEQIKYWQVENEPFLTKFGDCKSVGPALLDREIALVKSLDSRPVLTTDSGELGDWLRARNRGDIFGTTMYRDVWIKGKVYFKYPLPPTWFKFKDYVTRIFAKPGYAKKVIVVEMQAEPWGPDPTPYISIAEQLKYMDLERLKGDIIYAKRARYKDIYLWGVEWWYFLKVKGGHPEFWEYAEELFGR